MARTENGRLAYADLLRVLAIIAVIFLHIAGGWLSQTTVGSPAWTTLYVYNALTRWAVPMFIMLSGAFLLDPQKSVTLKDIFLKYILRLLVALLVWGSFYAILDYGHTNLHFTWDSIKSALSHVLKADTHYHLWFLYVMIGLYLLTPILRAFVRGASRGTFHWFFLVCFVFYSVIPTLRYIMPERMANVCAWTDQFHIYLVLGFVGYFVAGYYLKHYTLNRFAEFFIYILGILGTVITIWGSHAYSIHRGASNTILFNYPAPNIVFVSVALFVLFRYVLGVSDERSRRQRLSGVAKISFGIYLVHDVFIMLLRYLDISTLSFSLILAVPVLSFAVFLCAFAVAWLISKIPLIGRFLT